MSLSSDFMDIALNESYYGIASLNEFKSDIEKGLSEEDYWRRKTHSHRDGNIAAMVAKRHKTGEYSKDPITTKDDYLRRNEANKDTVRNNNEKEAERHNMRMYYKGKAGDYEQQNSNDRKRDRREYDAAYREYKKK